MSSFLFDEALNSWHEIPNDEIFIIWDLLFDCDKNVGFFDGCYLVNPFILHVHQSLYIPFF